MQPTLPVPTDSLYKFAALFGLVLLVTSVIAFNTSYNNTHAELTSLAQKYIDIELKQGTAARQMRRLLDTQIEIADSNRDFRAYFIALTLAIGTLSSGWGFFMWHRLQPLRDELLELEVLLARKEVYGDTKPRAFTPREPSLTPRPQAEDLRKSDHHQQRTPGN